MILTFNNMKVCGPSSANITAFFNCRKGLPQIENDDDPSHEICANEMEFIKTAVHQNSNLYMRTPSETIIIVIVKNKVYPFIQLYFLKFSTFYLL